ncbi:hypothetical protein F5I97DRAFT_1975992 [Phlebopus sp. FC_14]|nr:hypothetical protein F5I97DRAFT_1975992 [Phlebopus sp. FC_14]
MHNGSLTPSGNMTIAELKENAKEGARKAAKGVSAISLIKSARSQLQLAQTSENTGDLRGAFGALWKAVSLATMAMNSAEYLAESQSGKHGLLYKEVFDFQKREGSNLAQRAETIESKLTDLEKSATTPAHPAPSHTNTNGSSRKIGTSIADRVKSLSDAGLSIDTTKHFSRDSPTIQPTTLPLKSPAPIPIHSMSASLSSPRPQVSAVIPPSSSSSTTSSPHAVVPPSSLGPPSPTSSDSSSPHTTLSEFVQAFPSIDELNELDVSRFPSVPQSMGSSVTDHRLSISHPNGVKPLIPPPLKQFPSLSIDPGPRPSSTPITPTMNAFMSRPASPAIVNKPSINSLASSPLSPKPLSIPEKPTIPVSNTITPKLLYEYMRKPGLKTLVIDIRTREEYDREHIRADAVVCLEPSVLERSGISASALEDSLLVAPREEWVLFQNREKFDIVVIYDASSEAYDGVGPLSAFVRTVYETVFRKMLRNTPILLIGGIQAWKREFGDEEVVRDIVDGPWKSPTSILENGISSTSASLPLSISNPDTLRHPLPSLSNSVWTPTEARTLPERHPPEVPTLARYPAQSDERNSLPDGPASAVHRGVLPRPASSSLSNDYGHAESVGASGYRMTPLVNGLASSTSSITYPTFTSPAPRPATTSSIASSFSPTSASFSTVSFPPQASINPSPLARRRSEYMDESQTPSTSYVPSTVIDYPVLQILRPPPPAAPTTSQRQDVRPRIMHASSYSTSTLQMAKTGPKPPTIPSDYPVTYWSDIQLNTAGLKNLGNTCYMNATIQCLSATVPFARFFTDGRWKTAVNMLNPLGTKGSLAAAFAKILYEMSHSELPHLNPIAFRKSICSHAGQFSGSDQHDSQEFLTFLLDGLHEDLNRVLKKPSNESSPEREAELEKLPQQVASEQEWQIYRMRNDSLIVDYFQGQFRNRMECLSCHHTSTTYNSFMYLSLPIPPVRGPSKVSLESCLDAFVKEEVLEKSEAWHCPKCKGLRKATKRLSLSRLPPILLIHLKRFSVKGPFTDKIETVVDFPLKALDLTNYMPPPLPPSTLKSSVNGTGPKADDDPRTQMPPYSYDLYAVTNHFGNLGNGHYTAFISSRGGWLYCDDSRVTITDAKEVVGRPAYVLYYKRIKT